LSGAAGAEAAYRRALALDDRLADAWHGLGVGPRGARRMLTAKQGITSNEILSQKRAENVMQFLISQGVKPELVSAHGYGDADPIDSNSTREGRAKNRRVELTLAASGS